MLMPVLETEPLCPLHRRLKGSEENTAGRKGFGKLKAFP